MCIHIHINIHTHVYIYIYAYIRLCELYNYIHVILHTSKCNIYILPFYI